MNNVHSQLNVPNLDLDGDSANKNIMHGFLFDNHNNVLPIFEHFIDICSRDMNVLDFDLHVDLDRDILNWSRSNVNMPIESQNTTSHLISVAMFPYLSQFRRYSLSKYVTLVSSCGIYQGQICDLGLELWDISRSNTNIPIEGPSITSYLIAIVLCSIPVSIFKLITVEMFLTRTLTFRIGQDEV